MLLGVDYYPEHWPEERWARDAELMRAAGLHAVRMGEFAWSKLEPRRQRYDFAWLARAVDVMAAHDIKVVLCTPTACPPAWLTDRHPAILPRDPSRVAKSFGGRRTYCPNNEAYRRYCRRIINELCRRFYDHSAVIGWQIDNEFGCHNTARCYCDTCARRFREWLYRKYGSLERLNEAWGTVFWGQQYCEWHHVPLPWSTIQGQGRDAHSPSLLLDYYRFASDSFVDFQKMQTNIIRNMCPDHFITHNFMGLFDQLDYFKLAEDLDMASWDAYPGDGSDPARVALAHDVTRGLKQSNFWVMEQQSGATGWWSHGPTPRPGQIRLWTYQSIAHGADAVLYFRWRTCRFGTEQFWHGVLDHDGEPRRRYDEVAKIGQEVEKFSSAWSGARSVNRIALLISYDADWALQIQPCHPGLSYWAHLRRFYDPLFHLGAGVDLVGPNHDLGRYALVIAPTLYLVDESSLVHFRQYVEDGGTLLLTMRSAVKDRNNVVADTRLPCGLNDLLGIAIEEYDSFPPGRRNTIRMAADNREYAAEMWADLIDLRGADALATFTQDFYAGAPALTSRQFGSGRALYLGTVCEHGFYADFLANLLDDLHVDYLADGTCGVEAVRREKDGEEILFLLNHGNEGVVFELDAEYRSVLEGKVLSGYVEMQPYDVRILKKA